MKRDSVLQFPVPIVVPLFIFSLVLVPAAKFSASDIHLDYSIAPCWWGRTEVFLVYYSFSKLMVNSVDQNVDQLSIRDGGIEVESIYLSYVVLYSSGLSKLHELAVASIRLKVVPIIMLKGILGFFPCGEGRLLIFPPF